jgi:penicillin V acylase-like amidase (Ntn superfamily)
MVACLKKVRPGRAWVFLSLPLLLLPWSHASDGRACTAFLLEEGKARVFGKSYDFDYGNGMAVFNKAGVAKKNLPYNPKDKQAQWTSRYASLTFDQFGREMPAGGMNEKGLVVEILWLQESQVPPPDDRPVLNELQWVQYQLDNFASVKEMLEHALDNRLASVYAKVHYLACDAEGSCAAFEFLNGKLATTSGKDLAVKVLTNDSYAQSAAFLLKHKGFGGKLPVPKGRGSLDRFVRASWMVKQKPSKKKGSIQRAFSVLDGVRSKGFTKWNIVYDMVGKKVSFRTAGHKGIKSVALDRFDRDCQKPVKILDINNDFTGDVFEKFADYTAGANQALSKESWDGLAGNFPPNVVSLVLGFPESFTCTSGPAGKTAGP